MRKNFVGLLVAALVFAIAASAQASHKKAEAAPVDPMMAKMIEVGTPGSEHAALQPLVGKWKVVNRSWMKPGDVAQESVGKSRIAWALDGRFLEQRYSGDWAGQKFEGLGYLGYDKMKKQYFSSWMDNMSTGEFEGTGKFDAKKNVVHQSGTFACPMTGDKNTWYRSEWKILDKNTNVFSMFTKAPNGKEFKSMEITYKRVR